MKRPKPNSRDRDSSSTVASGFDSKATVEILLTWVCSRWRHIALEMPSLWATVLAHPPAATTGIGWGIYDVSMSEPTIREIYLKRSSQMPLTICLSYDLSRSGAIELLAEHSSRWGTAELHLLTSEDQFIKSPLHLKGKLPLVEHLACSMTSLEADLFQVAPSLRSLEYCGGPAGSTIVNPNFPWSQLEVLVHHPNTQLQFLDVLRKCTNLSRSATLHDRALMNIIGQPHPADPPIVSHVRDFHADINLSRFGYSRYNDLSLHEFPTQSGNSKETFMNFLESIILPNVSSISLHFYRWHTESGVWSTPVIDRNNSFIRFLSHSKSHLCRLCLTGDVRLSESLLHTILSQLSTLQVLEIQEPSPISYYPSGDDSDEDEDEDENPQSCPHPGKECQFGLNLVIDLLTASIVQSSIGTKPAYAAIREARNATVLLPRLRTLKLISSSFTNDSLKLGPDSRCQCSEAFNEDLFINMVSSRSRSAGLESPDDSATGPQAEEISFNYLQSVTLTVPRPHEGFDLEHRPSPGSDSEILSHTSQERLLALTRPSHPHHTHHDQSLNSSARDGNLQIIVRGWYLQLRFYNGLVIRDCV
jgi:hypothetical protein